MKELFVTVANYTVEVTNLMAVVIIAIGTAAAFFRCLRSMFKPGEKGYELREAYLRYGRWLIAGLTFQLAADIVETSIAPNWEDIGRLGAIAVIRTFLNYFLDRDIKEVLKRQELAMSLEEK